MFRAKLSKVTRIAAVSALPLVFSGCAVSPVIALLSTAAEGVSFAFSGKSISDNAVSVAANRDCAFFRVLKGEAVCNDNPTPPDDAIQTASADSSRIATTAPREPEQLALAPSFGINDPAMIRTYKVKNGDAAIVEYADALDAQVLTLEGFTWRTEVYGLIQDDGSLEIFAHDPTHRDAGYNIQMVAKIIDFKSNPRAFNEIRVNGRAKQVGSIVVDTGAADAQG